MRSLISAIVLFNVIFGAHAQPINSDDDSFQVIAKVDQRVELLTIIARLAEFEEYSSTPLDKYAADIDDFFNKFKKHKAVSIFKQLRKDNGLGYDAVMTMAVHLTPPPNLEPKINLSIDTLDDRWGNDQLIQEFVKQLQKFYTDTNCQRFFNEQRKLYDISAQRFQTLLNTIDFSWYQKFYGELPDGNFNLFIRLHSKGSYGPSVTLPDGSKHIYAVLSTSETDNNGLPIYRENRLGTIIHEFNHSFINHLFFKNISEFETSGKIIFDKVGEQLKKVGYGNWESTVIESLANAAEARYLRDAAMDSTLVRKNLLIDQHRGFYWLDELVDLLGAYNQNRNLYPTFSSFFPFLIGYFNDLSARIDNEIIEFNYLRPHIIALAPFNNNSNSVDHNISQFKFTFDKPLDIIPSDFLEKIKKDNHQIPVFNSFNLNTSGMILTLELELQPNQQYSFILPGRLLVTKQGYKLDDYKVAFKTADN